MASTPLNAPLPRGWRSRLRQWWTNRHVAREHLVLTQRNFYIVPTRVGLLFALTLAVLLVASINYQLNLGHLLTFLLTGSAVVSMYITHATLRGLRLHLSPLPRMYAQHPCELTLRVDAPAGSDRHGLCARLEGATTPTSEGTWSIKDGAIELVWTKVDGEDVEPGTMHKTLWVSDDGASFKIDTYVYERASNDK